MDKLYVGRKKTARAVLTLESNGTGIFRINKFFDKSIFFNNLFIKNIVNEPLSIISLRKAHNFNIKVSGGGIISQARATAFALTKALLDLNIKFKPLFKKLGLLSADSRIKERKKTGKPKARKSFQFSKR
jgi:small subunit ribosomal protein S9